MIKTITKQEIALLEFTPEEREELGFKPGDKFTVTLNEDGSLALVPFVSVEIDLGEFSKEQLEILVARSIELQVPPDEVIREGITEMVKRHNPIPPFDPLFDEPESMIDDQLFKVEGEE